MIMMMKLAQTSGKPRTKRQSSAIWMMTIINLMIRHRRHSKLYHHMEVKAPPMKTMTMAALKCSSQCFITMMMMTTGHQHHQMKSLTSSPTRTIMMIMTFFSQTLMTMIMKTKENGTHASSPTTIIHKRIIIMMMTMMTMMTYHPSTCS